MTQYMLAVHYVDGQEPPSDDVMQQMFDDVGKLNVKMQESDALVFAGGLETPEIATVVRAQDGDVLTTDGPFSESKEQIGGFWIIEAADLDEALDWARQATVACRGPVEVRPFQAE